MKKNYFKILFLIFLFVFSNSYSQQKDVWRKTDPAHVLEDLSNKNIKLRKYESFELGISKLKNELKKAPKESKNDFTDLKVEFPNDAGEMISFFIKEAPVMDMELSKRFPNNRSYRGYGVHDPTLKIRFSVNVLGLHAMIIDKENQIQYISPSNVEKSYYKIYDRRDLDVTNIDFQCMVEKSSALKSASAALDLSGPNDLKLRTYRLALAGTGEYSQFQLDLSGIDQSTATDEEKKAVVLAAMTTAMTRVNAIFENDLAIRMVLVSNNTDLIYLDPDTDPYTNSDGSAMLDENQTNCDNVIGSPNYDIGHVFGTGDKGVAYLGEVCVGSGKAGGVTGSVVPSGDNFYFDFVAHEMGHQFGANHSFNGDESSCSSTTRNDLTAIEPGSGSTLMAYAGLCTPQNVQTHSDLYFHAISIDEIWTYITSGAGTCSIETSLTNNSFAPTANAGNDIIIPKSTAYKLIGQGSDGDNDPISFCWEQVDNELNSVPPSDTDTDGTIYRSRIPNTSATRYLPELSTVNSGALSSTWEVTPSVGRTMNFSLTVRDNNKEAGQIAIDDMLITVSDVAGPFAVTSQNTAGVVWEPNTTEIISWDVAGTDGNGINTTQVNILLSIDGGKNYNTILASNTPNDGTQGIIVPNTLAPNCKIMVESVGNLFYALNGSSFSIGEFISDCSNFQSTDVPIDIPDDDSSGIVSSLIITENNPILDVNVNVKITHSWIGDLTLILESPSGTQVKLISGPCGGYEDIDVTFDDDGSDVGCGNLAPAISGVVRPAEPLSIFLDENSTGEWKLRVMDDAEQDTGSLDEWSLDLCTSTPLDVNTDSLENFKLYPNPSDGNFNVSFVKNSDEVQLSLFDVLGRKIRQLNFDNPSLFFDENIQFGGVSFGLYILKIRNGNNFVSRKIQIR